MSCDRSSSEATGSVRTPAGTVSARSTVRGIYDLRRMAQVVIDTEIQDEKGEKIATTTSAIICRGEGGFGGDPPPKEDVGISIPDRPADFVIEEKTSPEQALLYRLSGDWNPLHADPEAAKSVGFERGPILHGLATYGHMMRHVAKGACAGDAQRPRRRALRNGIAGGKAGGAHVVGDACQVAAQARDLPHRIRFAQQPVRRRELRLGSGLAAGQRPHRVPDRDCRRPAVVVEARALRGLFEEGDLGRGIVAPSRAFRHQE